MNTVTATQQEKGILKALTKDRVRTWIKQNVTENQMKAYLQDPRWIYIMSQRVFKFQKENF